jgi:hypothetical protein
MPARRQYPKTGLRITELLEREIENAMASFNDPAMSQTTRGRFCYIAHRGQPLCRLGYTGDDMWDFSIYRYSTGSYGNGGSLLPAKTTLVNGIDTALCAYELK